MKLGTKLTGLFLALSIIPLAIVGYLAYENGQQTIRQNTFNRLISTNVLKEGELSRWIEANQQGLRALARRPLIREYAATLVAREPADPAYQAAHTAILEDHFTPTLEEEGGFERLSILRPSDGQILVSTNRALEGRYRERERYFTEGRRGTYVDKVVYSLSLQEVVMHVGTPIRDDTGALIAVLAGHVDLDEMADIMLQRSGLSGSEESYLVNQFNFFITEPWLGNAPVLQKAVHTQGVEDCLAHNDGVGLYEDYRGIPVIGAYRWIPEREMCLLTEVDQAEAFSPIIALRNTTLGIGGVVALGVGLLGVFFARTITEPVRQLWRGAEEIGRGNLEHHIVVQSHDEIGQLAQAFNEMTAKRKAVEDQLREQQAFLESIYRGAELAIFVVDVTEDGDFRYAGLNPAHENLTGMQSADVEGKAPEDLAPLIPPEATAAIRANYARCLEAGKAIEYEEMIPMGGRERWWLTKLTPVRNAEGRVYRIIGTSTDITARVEAEEEVRRHRDHLEELVQERTAELERSNAELKRSNAELERFAYVASHDLQEPLRMVSSYLQLVERRYTGQLDADADEFIGYAVGGANRMKKLINDLLAYSRVDTRGREFAPTDCDRLARNVLRKLTPVIEETGARLTLDPLPTVMADEQQLAQVFENLIDNAIKFRGERLPAIHVGVERQDGEWVFSVQDNGIGIDPEYFERIFVIFRQLHTRDKYDGTGLGLALSKRIVERHGGRIWVESQPGAGSTFYFSLSADDVCEEHCETERSC